MEATTAAVVLLFVISIFGGFGNNNGDTSSPTFPKADQGLVYQNVQLTEPAANFSAVDAGLAQLQIKNYILKYRSADVAAAITDSIMKHARTYDLNPKLAAALIARESKFNPRAVSSSGALGLGQLLPSTCKGLQIDDGFDVDQNARGTVRYIKSLVDRFKGKVSNAIAAYLEGPNAVARQGGYSEHTKTYVEDILAIYNKI